MEIDTEDRIFAVLMSWGRFGAAVCAAILLAGCFGAPPPARYDAASASEMSPDAKTIALLYVADRAANKVSVFSYPQGVRKGVLTGFVGVEGLCVDPSGDVWVVDSKGSTLFEYAHGEAHPIATLQDPNHEYPWTCSVNPRNGDLAVANIKQGKNNPGSVSIFTGAQGRPKIYLDQSISEMISLSYDDRDNLFVAGIPYARPRFAFAEMHRNRKKFVGISLVGVPIKSPGGLQFADGKLAIGGDQGRSIVYEFSDGTITGETPLLFACRIPQFFVDGLTLVATSVCRNHKSSVLFYGYPSGGRPIKRISGFDEPVGVVISN